MKSSRLVSILLLLQTRGRLTADQLAAELEVSVRTVYRDVEALQAAGVPLYGDAGHRGGYQLLAGYRTRLTGFNTGEAEALFLSGLPGPAADLGLGPALAAAQLKLRAALPPELRGHADRMRSRFHLEAPGWYAEDDEVPFLPQVADAVWRGQVLDVRYRRWKEPTDVDRQSRGGWYSRRAGGIWWPGRGRVPTGWTRSSHYPQWTKCARRRRTSTLPSTGSTTRPTSTPGSTRVRRRCG